ncbi:MAG TPA: nuclear transport factor 2 family protein [Solirubrobacteraceae bacterium]|nr:nuclear transport factor 2 family protein [Solirubrobacteraceae bacterium]
MSGSATGAGAAPGVSEMLDRLAVRELIDDWTVLRDARLWERWYRVWHDDGVIFTTWGGRTTPQQFAAKADAGYAQGDRMLHSNGGTSVELAGDRAVSMSKMRIMQVGPVEGVLCEVCCIGRNYDLCERRDGRWGIVLRQPIYERDMAFVADPATVTHFEREKLEQFPDGYARLAYMQAELGYKIRQDMPLLEGPQLDALYEQGRVWLAGGELSWGLE